METARYYWWRFNLILLNRTIIANLYAIKSFMHMNSKFNFYLSVKFLVAL